MITEDYVSNEIAKLLKEKGFDEECRAFWKDWNGQTMLCHCSSSHVFEWCHNSMLEEYYNDSEETNIAAPTLQLAMKWLRKEHKLFIEIGVSIDSLGNPHFNYSIVNKDGKYFREGYTSFEWKHEKACENAIKYCLENLV